MNKRNVLSAKNLSKIYKKSSDNVKVINNLNLDERGEIFGLLANGAGNHIYKYFSRNCD